MTDTATKILLVAGMANLLVGALSGIPMGLGRMKGEATVPKYLTMVHLAGLMQGPLLIGVGVALTISTLSPWVNTLAAVLLAVSSGLLIAKDTINWRQGVKDEFAEQTLGLTLGNIFGPMHIVGLFIACAGVISGL